MKAISLTILVMACLVTVLAVQENQHKPESGTNFVSKGAVPMDFESVALGKLPRRWIVPTGGYVAEVVDWDKASGKRCAHLKQVGKPEHGFGNLMTIVMGKEVAGKDVEFSAKLKSISAPEARIWMRVDRLNGGVGSFDNMAKGGVAIGKGWQVAKIRMRINDDAKYVMFGAMAIHHGDILVDDIQIRIVR